MQASLYPVGRGRWGAPPHVLPPLCSGPRLRAGPFRPRGGRSGGVPAPGDSSTGGVAFTPKVLYRRPCSRGRRCRFRRASPLLVRPGGRSAPLGPGFRGGELPPPSPPPPSSVSLGVWGPGRGDGVLHDKGMRTASLIRQQDRLHEDRRHHVRLCPQGHAAS